MNVEYNYSNASSRAINQAVDGATTAIRIVDYSHHEVHSGSHYTLTMSSGTLDDGQALSALIITPDTTKWTHMLMTAYGALRTKIEAYEDCTHTSGTILQPRNNNRNYPDTPGTIVALSNEDNANGTLIYEAQFGVDTGGKKGVVGGGEARSDGEWVLKQNTKYLFKMISLTDDNVVSVSLSWYEHTNNN